MTPTAKNSMVRLASCPTAACRPDAKTLGTNVDEKTRLTPAQSVYCVVRTAASHIQQRTSQTLPEFLLSVIFSDKRFKIRVFFCAAIATQQRWKIANTSENAARG